MSTVPYEVICRYAYKHAIALEEANRAFDELELFLDSASSSAVVPSEIVDLAWHEFILHTRLYSEYCQHRFGCFVHHVPLSPLANGNSPDEEKKDGKKCGTGIYPVSPLEMEAHGKCSSDCRSSCRKHVPEEYPQVGVTR